LHPVRDLVVFHLRWPWADAAQVISAWQAWAPVAPDELWSDLALTAVPGAGTPSLWVGGAYAGRLAAANALLGQLAAAVGAKPESAVVRRESYLAAMNVFAGCSSLSQAQCHLPSQNRAGVLKRGPKFAKSDFFVGKIPATGIATLLSGMEQMLTVAGAAGAAGHVTFDALGGAINRVSPPATAFVHRRAQFDAQYQANWTAIQTKADDAGAGTPAVQRQLAWLRSLYASMRPYASGECYQNYVDPDLADWQLAYYGANYPRLRRIKAAVDPANMFRFPQSIR